VNEFYRSRLEQTGRFYVAFGAYAGVWHRAPLWRVYDCLGTAKPVYSTRDRARADARAAALNVAVR
jgi:hypothetical protein